MKKILTLCLIYNQEKILLGYKKVGFGQGRWNGFGGKLQEDESIEQAAKRELLEEAGVEAIEILKRGILNFKYQNDSKIHEVHVFQVLDFVGEPTETEEMKPQWFKLDEIPFSQMWPDDKYWLPFLLAGKNFTGSFLFEDQTRILNHEIKEI